MKKALALLLSCLMLIGVFGGCSAEKPGESTPESTANEVPHSMQLGYGRVDITPADSVPLGGHHQETFADRVEDPLYATCLAFTDETGNTVLIFHLDLLQSYSVANMTRKKISNETGVDALQIYMCSTHNHSAPNLESTNGNIETYNKTFPDKLVEAAKAAMADRKPVTGMHITAAYPENLNFCRHHILDDGSRTGWASPAVSRGVAHLLKADNELQLVKLTREGGKDVIMMNWQGHPDASAGAKNAIASDVDIIRKELEPLLDCHFTYFLGASGNVNSKSYVRSELQSDWYISYYKDRCKKLAEYAVAATENFQQISTDTIRIDTAKQPINFVGGSGLIDVPITSISFGDLAFCMAPYEMFTEFGQQIKQGSPFAMTIISTCSTGAMSYIPAAYAFEYSSYEGDNSRYAPGSAEIMAEAHIQQLQRLFDAAK